MFGRHLFIKTQYNPPIALCKKNRFRPLLATASGPWCSERTLLPPLLHTSTILVAKRGTKIVFRLLPRLQHWQHDMAIHSQYCISLAFCEHTSANLRPQSALLSIFEGCGEGLLWWGCGGGILPLTLHSIPPKLTHTLTPIQQLADNTVRVPARHQSVRGVIEAVSMQAHVSLLYLQVCSAERGWHRMVEEW